MHKIPLLNYNSHGDGIFIITLMLSVHLSRGHRVFGAVVTILILILLFSILSYFLFNLVLLGYFSSDCVCEVKEDMYDGANSQLALLAQLGALSNQLVVSTWVHANVNPIRGLQCDFCDGGHINGYCVPYIEEAHYIGHFKSQTIMSTPITHDRMIIQVLTGVTIKFKILTGSSSRSTTKEVIPSRRDF